MYTEKFLRPGANLGYWRYVFKETRIVVRSRKGITPACWAVRLGTNNHRITENFFLRKKGSWDAYGTLRGLTEKSGQETENGKKWQPLIQTRVVNCIALHHTVQHLRGSCAMVFPPGIQKSSGKRVSNKGSQNTDVKGRQTQFAFAVLYPSFKTIQGQGWFWRPKPSSTGTAVTKALLSVRYAPRQPKGGIEQDLLEEHPSKMTILLQEKNLGSEATSLVWANQSPTAIGYTKKTQAAVEPKIPWWRRTVMLNLASMSNFNFVLDSSFFIVFYRNVRLW